MAEVKSRQADRLIEGSFGMESSYSVSIIVAFAGGVLSFLSPCILPLIPSYLSVVSGVSYEELGGTGTQGWRIKKRVFLSAFLFVSGFSLIFILLGASVTALTASLMGIRDGLNYFGGTLVLFFGLFLTGSLKIRILKRYFQPLDGNVRTRVVGYTGAFLVGLSFGIGWTPCIGPILGSILTLAAIEVGKGIFLLTTYSAGLAIPFLLAAVAFNGFLGFFQRFKRLLPAVQKSSGVVLILMGILILTGQLTVLNSYALRYTPEWLVKWL